MTADGRPYYQNTITKKTSWLPPEGWVEPGAAASTEAETTVAAARGSFFKSSGTAVDVRGLGVEATTEEAAAAVAPTPIGRVGGKQACSGWMGVGRVCGAACRFFGVGGWVGEKVAVHYSV